MIARLAWRSIWRNKRRTLISIVSITLGLTLAIGFMSLGEGQYLSMIEQIVRMQAGHLTIEHTKYRQAPAMELYLSGADELRKHIEALPGVLTTKQLVTGQGMARTGTGAVGVSLLGVEPSREAATSPLAGNMVSGKFLSDGDKRHVIIGSELARRLKLKVGKKLVLTVNNAGGDLAEELCRVRGIFKTGSLETDAGLVLCPIGFARKLYGLPKDGATQLGLVLKEPSKQGRMLVKVRAALKDNQQAVHAWQQIMPELANYIRVDRASNWVFQGFLIALVLFTIFNTFLMSVLEREREFAVQIALGTRPAQIMAQVLCETVYLGLMGCLAGLGLGCALALYVDWAAFDLTSLMEEGVTVSGFAMSLVLRAKLTPLISLGVTGLVFAATLLLGVLPMRRVAKIPITDHLRQGG
jgi:ABC-type lipoprotein release transport system permease subunit